MALDDPAGDGESQARATGRRVGRPPESIECPRNVFRSKAAAIVVDGQDSRAVGGVDRHLDRMTAGYRRMTDRVVEEDDDELT